MNIVGGNGNDFSDGTLVLIPVCNARKEKKKNAEGFFTVVISQSVFFFYATSAFRIDNIDFRIIKLIFYYSV